MTSGELDVLTISSTRGPDHEPVCGLHWHGEHWHAPVADVRETALDLVTCASYAEMMMQLRKDLNLPPRTVSALVTALFASQGRKRFGCPTTIGLLPAGDSRKNAPVVLLKRKQTGRQGLVDAAGARRMALRWLEAAEGTESEQLLSEAMRGAAIGPDVTEKVFGYLRELRR